MLTLGLWTGLRAAAAVARGGTLLAAVEDVWITRRMASSGFPAGAIDAALDAAGVRARDVERVVVVSRFPLRWAPAVRRCRIAGSIAGVPVERALATALAAGAPVFEGAAAIGAALAGEHGVVHPLSPDAAWGPAYDEQACYRALSAASLPRDKVEDADALAVACVAQGREVARFSGAMRFGRPGLERAILVPAPAPRDLAVGVVSGAAIAYRALTGIDGLICCSPGDVVRWWRAGNGQVLLLGPWVLRRS